ncbi:MAG: hypothetical protein ABIL69_07260 [candidate division WOR-3 bacterium]
MSQKPILIGLLLFTAIFFFFYPANTGIVDETAYLSTTYTLQNGRLYYDEAGVNSTPASISINSHLISRYPPGNSILLLPFTKLNYKFIFLRGYILLLLGVILLIAILSHYNLPSYYALLFLFHPSIVLYSRTIMSDLPATIFALAGLLFFIKKKYFLAGIILGLSIAIRYPLLLIPFALWVVLSIKKEFINSIKFLIGVIVGLSPLLIYHISIFNKITGPAGANIIGFSMKNLPVMFFQFFLALNILYPLMLLTCFRTKLNEKWYFIFPALIFIIFFSFQYYIDTGKNFIETLIRGQRYMLPVIPFLIIPYSEVLERIKFFKKILTVLIIVLFFFNIILSIKHQRFLNKQTYYQNKIYEYTKDADLIICNKDIYELINPFIKSIKWVSFESEGKLINVNISNGNKKIYLACLARNEHIKNLFYELLNKTGSTKGIYKEESPHYFAIYLLQNK